jgi:immunoglobulin-binding protein 1
MGEGRSIPPELLAAMAAQGGGVAYSAGGGRDVTAREVFRPSHILPTMTIEEAGEIEYQELMERTVREAKNKMRAAAEEAAMTADEKDDRDLAKARSWDEFKDDNPFGAGNSKLRPCS